MTLQAPHSLAPQPKCGPVMPSCPRRISSNDRSGSASTVVSAPLRRNRIRGIESGTLILVGDLRLVAEFLDDLSPFHNVAAQIFVELLRGHRHRNHALFGPKFYDFRPLHRGIHGSIEFVDNTLR